MTHVGVARRRVTADDIAACLARNTFKDAAIAVDRCYALGDECDILVVARNLRYIDVEVKVSRADLKADRRKDKWRECVPWGSQAEPRHLDWPRGVWKHYFAMPEDIWKPELVEFMSPCSGVLLVRGGITSAPRFWRVKCARRARANNSAPPASPDAIVNLARLAGFRMWDTYEKLEAQRAAAEIRGRFARRGDIYDAEAWQ